MESTIIGVATAVGVAIGLGIHQARQSKKNASLAEGILPLLTARGPLTLPVLAEELGMNGLTGRGKVAMALNAMVSEGTLVVVDAPEGTPQLKKVHFIQYKVRG